MTIIIYSQFAAHTTIQANFVSKCRKQILRAVHTQTVKINVIEYRLIF